MPPKPELTVALGFIYTSPYRTQDCSYTGEYTYPRPRSKALGLGGRSGSFCRPRTPPRQCLRATSHTKSRVLEAYRGCCSLVGDPMTLIMTLANGRVRRHATKTPSSPTCNCASSRYRRPPLSVPLAMMLPWAVPAQAHCSQGSPR